jgi:hypothetical protein
VVVTVVALTAEHTLRRDAGVSAADWARPRGVASARQDTWVGPGLWGCPLGVLGGACRDGLVRLLLLVGRACGRGHQWRTASRWWRRGC